ncbi:zinc transporter ZIP10 isoform X2 [Falco biarmicus]|uniref:zinc transporter ZIP10 isoform X2 n=1 Tax=Falco cherrug TaxID=345164 RepID=UPI002479FAEF|nr:zinc transporter ZIP10 isoform X2 [Falco cherrug]XP_055668940.1 zinc transporter ZIP10 isoform X2 [Falco peregrinus]XP_056206125.1 zinc transporter ZIP10 isoform X2 [Falco biarmicus]
MKVHMHTKFCIICLLTFVFHQCNHCHEGGHDHGPKEERVHYHNDYQISNASYFQNGGTESVPSKFSTLEAENEQKYYIEKIFERYGENGRLSFFGLERLLISLGLGEVKVVMISHDDIGHDHVSHLYALEVQEGKHSHSHNHPHSHADSENQTVVGMAAKRNRKCDPERDAVVSSVKDDGKHMHDQSRHHHHHHPRLHHHDHNGTHHSRNDSVGHSEHGEQNHEPSTETNTTQDQPERKQRKQKKKQKKISEPSGDATRDYAPDHDSGDQYEHNRVHKHDHVHDASHLHVHHHEHSSDRSSHGHQDSSLGNEDGHHHTSKREAPHKQISVRKHTLSSAHSHKDRNEDEHDHEECLNVTQLLRHYGLETSSPISPELFIYMCPALLYQIERRLCIVHYDELEDFMKSKNASMENKDKTGASALAVGTMSGDALLHLLPHSHGGHNHSHHHGQGHVHEHKRSHRHAHGHGARAEGFLEENDPVLKGLVALGGIYVLFIIEHCIRMYKHYNKQKSKQKWCKKKQTEESPIGRKLSDHKLNNRPDADWLQLKPLAGADDSVLSEDRLNETELTDLDGQLESPPKNFLSVEEDNNMHHSHNDVSRAAQERDLHDSEYDSHGEDKMIARKHSHHWHHKHSHHSHGHCHSGKDLKDTGIANIAWMVIMGDGIHNFSDGLAIGAAFSAGLTGGISTSIAVFCHELPHELGDFAVLLKAGMTVKQAIVYNLLSAMMAYIGMLIGTAVGQYANNITLWIFAVTAGMFLYVALVDMLPEMLHGDGDNEEHGYCPVGQFILQNLGLLLGFAIMLVIALYEDKIVLDIQF